MRQTVLKHIFQRFDSMLELVQELEGSFLGCKLPIPANKSIGEHMWCIIGARESYARSLLKGSWAGFECSLQNSSDKVEIMEKLELSRLQFTSACESVEDWTQERDELLVHLLEHETMHEGQLIRHIYALEQPIPAKVKWA
ncbi:hypothetical protein [Vibrio caribbeanicus]|uniref:hypothetical protein n=1 Tax=Vibrio caribbeanicus TaxID=701175 RepID=UPI0030D92E01